MTERQQRKSAPDRASEELRQAEFGTMSAGGFDRATTTPLGSAKGRCRTIPLISSITRYSELLSWLFADVWAHCRRLILAVFWLDVLGLGNMAGAYGMGRKILAQVNGKAAVVHVWGHQIPVVAAVGLAAGLILIALLVHSAARLASHRVVLIVATRYQAAAVASMWSKIRDLGGQRSPADCAGMQRMVFQNSRILGISARLAVMSVSGSVTALFFAALAVHSAPRTALVFLVVGLGIFGFMLRNNRLAAAANRRFREQGKVARIELKEIFGGYQQGEEAQVVGERLRKIFQGGSAFRAAKAYSEQLFRVYQSQFLMSAGAAFAIALAVVLPLLEGPRGGGGAVVPVAMTATGLVLLKQAFGFAGVVAGHLTRFNLRYQMLQEHRRFLKTGQLPNVHAADESGEEAEDIE